jgi:hypothetical protein
MVMVIQAPNKIDTAYFKNVFYTCSNFIIWPIERIRIGWENGK